MATRGRTLLVLGLLLAMALIYVCFDGKPPSEDLSPSEGLTPTSDVTGVALYSDSGVWDESVKSLERMFRWMNRSVTIVDAGYINSKGLCDFDVLCVPGGDMYQYSKDVSSAGRKNIRRFVREGGGYLGVCGGSYFAGESVAWRGSLLQMTPLGIFPGRTWGPIDEITPYPNYAMSKIGIVDPTHPITSSGPESEWMLYYWGPALEPNPGANVTILGRYEGTGQPAIVAFEYGLGRVFLIGAHPEIEEDSDRDGNSFAEGFDDGGSDWPLMRRAVLWLEREEITP